MIPEEEYKGKFGTSPVSDDYFKVSTREEIDKALRDCVIASSVPIPPLPPPEEDEAIWVDLSGDKPIYSKGWKDFFSFKDEK